jgi:hypothetical protein
MKHTHPKYQQPIMSRSKLSNTELKFYNSSGESDVIYAKIKGSSTDTLILEGASSATKVRLTNVADPTSTSDVATYDWVNTKMNELSNGLSWKKPARAMATADLPGTMVGNVLTCTASAQQTMDGVLITLNDRVLLSEQTDPKQNGVYVCSTQGDGRGGSEAQAVFTRATDADSSDDLKSASVFVEQGTVHADTAYVQSTDGLVLGSSDVVFVQFSSPGEILAGVGLSKSGNTISANVDDTTLEIEAGSLVVKDLGITLDKVATNTLTGAQVQDGSLTDAEMADDSCINRCILTSAVDARCLATGSVTSIKIVDASITSDKLGANSVTTPAILDANVTTAKLNDACITSDKIDTSAILATHLSAGCVVTATIGDAQVSTGKVQDASVTTAKLASQCVTSSKLSPANVLTSHIAANQITTALIASDQIQAAHLKASSVTNTKIQDAAVTADKLAANSVTTSKMGTLSGLTVNGIVNATGFVASGAGGESDGGFALPKAKSLSIDFTTDQTVAGDSVYAIAGSDSALSAISFAYDDNITMAIAFSTFRLKHSGTNGTTVGVVFEAAYYSAAGVVQDYFEMTGQESTFGMYSATEHTYQLGNTNSIGDGATPLARIRLKVKHDVASDTVAISDSLQLTALAIDDSSGNVTRTFSSGSIV